MSLASQPTLLPPQYQVNATSMLITHTWCWSHMNFQEDFRGYPNPYQELKHVKKPNLDDYKDVLNIELQGKEAISFPLY